MSLVETVKFCNTANIFTIEHTCADQAKETNEIICDTAVDVNFFLLSHFQPFFVAKVPAHP